MSEGKEGTVPPGEESELSLAAVGDFLLRRGFKLSALELFEEAREAGVAEDDLGPLAAEFSRADGRTPPSEHHAYKPGRVAFGTEKEKDEYLYLLEYELRIAREDLDAERLKVDALTHGRPVTASSSSSSSSLASADQGNGSGSNLQDAQQQQGQEQQEQDQQQQQQKVTWQAALCARRRAAHTAAIAAGGVRAEGRVADTVRGLRALGGAAGMVELVAECLPNVVRGVIMSKRDEVVPLLLETVLRHKDAETRAALLKLLLALLKQPDEQQRALLVEAVAVLAELMGAARASAELVPPLVLDCASKYEERRVLVAAVCGAVAPFVTADARARTLRNVCVQMVNDRSDLVRRAAVRALARLVTLFGREDAALLMPLEEELCRLLDDRSEVVVEAALGTLLTALVDFADATDQLPALCAKLASQASSLLASLSPAGEAESAEGEADSLCTVSDTPDPRTAPAERLFRCLDACLPRFCERLLTSLPGAQPPACVVSASSSSSSDSTTSTSTSGNSTSGNSTSGTTNGTTSVWVSKEEKDAYVALLGEFVRAHPLECNGEQDKDKKDGKDDKNGDEDTTQGNEEESRRALAWVARELLPALFRVAERTPASEGRALDGATALVRLVGRELGEGFQGAVLVPALRRRLAELPAATPARARLLVVWLAAGAGAQPDTEIRQCLFDVVSDMAQDGRAWTMAHLPALRHATDLLAQAPYGAHQSLLLRVLSELSSSPSVRIRAATAALYSAVVPHISAESTRLSVFSVLAALHTDPDAAVRAETAQVFVAILQRCPHDRDLAERAAAALDMLAQDQAVLVRAALCRAIVRYSPLISSQLFFSSLVLPFPLHTFLPCALIHTQTPSQTSPRTLPRSHRRCAASTATPTRTRSVSRCGRQSRRSVLHSQRLQTTPAWDPSSLLSRPCSPTRPTSLLPRSRTSILCLCFPFFPSLFYLFSLLFPTQTETSGHISKQFGCGRSPHKEQLLASHKEEVKIPFFPSFLSLSFSTSKTLLLFLLFLDQMS